MFSVHHKLSFKDLAMTCARGVLSNEDLAQIGDGPIPDDFRLAENPELAVLLGKAKERLVQLKKMDLRQCKSLMLEGDDSGAISLHNARMKQGKKNAETLTEELENWVPPSSEHEILRELMKTELLRRVEECSLKLPEHKLRITSKDLLLKKIAAQEIYVERLKTKVQNERERVNNVNAWLDALRNSLTVQSKRKTA